MPPCNLVVASETVNAGQLVLGLAPNSTVAPALNMALLELTRAGYIAGTCVSESRAPAVPWSWLLYHQASHSKRKMFRQMHHTTVASHSNCCLTCVKYQLRLQAENVPMCGKALLTRAM